MIFKGVPLCERFSCTDMMMNLAALLLALTAVTIASGRLLQLDDDDKETFVSEHNRLRAAVTPAARNMKKLVCSMSPIRLIVSYYQFIMVFNRSGVIHWLLRLADMYHSASLDTAVTENMERIFMPQLAPVLITRR